MLLYDTLKRDSTPIWAKTAILGALGYFICPVDAIPDLIPGVGYTDDFGVMMAALATGAAHIDDKSRVWARRTLQDWFGDVDDTDLSAIDSSI